MNKKIKVMVLGDDPRHPSGVANQMRYFINGLLKTGRYSFTCIGGALRHANYDVVQSPEYGEDFMIYPTDGYGTHEMVRALLKKHKPDVMWIMTDPRYWEWLWTIENEIRPVYKTVNELRPGNKPKLSYEGRTVDGQKGETRAEYGQVQKQNPLREAERGYDDFLKGQSNFRKPTFTDKDNYIPVLKDTGRMYTEEVSASGPARTDFGVRQYLVREDETTNFTPME